MVLATRQEHRRLSALLPMSYGMCVIVGHAERFQMLLNISLSQKHTYGFISRPHAGVWLCCPTVNEENEYQLKKKQKM